MGLYIQIHSMHGLFRSYNIELGRDEDTGGQITYLLELAQALGRLKEVDKVDIITRRIVDSEYEGYSHKIEKVDKHVSIVRIECGPKKYIKKVNLWPHIDEFVKNTKAYIKDIGRTPDILHSNYADSGLVCSIISKDFGIPQVHTGHSLGIPKMDRLGITEKNKDKFKNFHFEERVEAENATIRNSSLIVASTEEEVREQYKKYDNIKKYKDKFQVIAPGIDIDSFYPPRKTSNEHELKTIETLHNVLNQDLKHPERKVISILSRLDKRKNLVGFMKAYGQDKELQKIANILIFAETLVGNIETQEVIKEFNKVLREYNLYDKVAIPGLKLDYQTQVPSYYRFLAEIKGIFINPALIEPFGLTILEAMACGIPVIATKNGGPSNIITDSVDGLLIDPNNLKDMATQVKKLVKDEKLYHTISKNAIINVKENYTWEAAAKKYLKVFNKAIELKK